MQRPYDHFGGWIKPYRAIWTHFRPNFQTLPAPVAPDELSDPNLTPLPTHPGIKYVARALAAMTELVYEQFTAYGFMVIFIMKYACP